MSMAANGHNVQIAKIFVVCNQPDTAPVWGFILRQQGLVVALEHSIEKAIEHWSAEVADLVVIDIDGNHYDRMQVYNRFRSDNTAPILLFLPSANETQILEAYNAGVDEVVVKPISPPIFLAKILAWARRGWRVPPDGFVQSRKHRLDPTRRCLAFPDGQVVNLTSLEFRLLSLLMSRPGHIFDADEIIHSIWGLYENGHDHVLLKNVVYRLRKKIEDNPSQPVLLQTWQSGYSFQV
jgi:two-component system OmpR family response regulator